MQTREIRDARDEDAAGLIALLGACFAEYPGCILDVDGEIPELRRIATRFSEREGGFWVAESDGLVVGSVGFLPCDGGVELCKLYVARSARRSGLGGRLCARVEEAARAAGAGFVELWSDTRFAGAHRLYARRGYQCGAHTRELHDSSHTREHYFRFDLEARA